MGFKKLLKEFFYKIDFFCQPVTMRFKEQPDYKTVTGGVVSLALVIVFLSIFSVTTFNTLKKQYITFTQVKNVETDPSLFQFNLKKQFMFALGINNINMNSGKRYFDIVMTSRFYDDYGKNRTEVQIPLAPCQKKQFETFGTEFGEAYDNLRFSEWLCPPSNMTLQIIGKYSSKTFKFYRITVNRCGTKYNISGRACVNQSTIQNYLATNQAYNFNFYFINKLLNPSEFEYINNFLDDFNYFPFSTKIGVSADIFISQYQFNTDESIWPISDINITEGGVVHDPAQRYLYAVQGDTYAKVYLRKSSTSYVYERQFRKADDTLSYIGGLFTAIIALMFIVGAYEESCYELQVARVILCTDDKEIIQTESFHFLNYLAFMFYKICVIFGLKPNMPKSQNYDKAIEEIKSQMDIRLVMKRLQHYENISKVQLSKPQNSVLFLKSQRTLSSAKALRKKYNYRRAIRRLLSQWKNKKFQKDCSQQPLPNNSNSNYQGNSNEIPQQSLKKRLSYKDQRKDFENYLPSIPIPNFSEREIQNEIKHQPYKTEQIQNQAKDKVYKLASYINKLQKDEKNYGVSKKILKSLDKDVLLAIQQINKTKRDKQLYFQELQSELIEQESIEQESIEQESIEQD